MFVIIIIIIIIVVIVFHFLYMFSTFCFHHVAQTMRVFVHFFT